MDPSASGLSYLVYWETWQWQNRNFPLKQTTSWQPALKAIIDKPLIRRPLSPIQMKSPPDSPCCGAARWRRRRRRSRRWWRGTWDWRRKRSSPTNSSTPLCCRSTAPFSGPGRRRVGISTSAPHGKTSRKQIK